ncbi:MAG: polysaccharide pyruvyl transferase family protein, partial [Acidimicrobiales bacterium]
THTRPATIVHIGAFDLASYGDQIFPLVAAHELSRRLGRVEVLPFGPLGASDGAEGGPSWSLGPWSAARAAQVARRATLVLCGGGEILQGDGTIYAPFYRIDPRDAAGLRIDRWYIEVLGAAEATCPVVWHSPGVPLDLDGPAAARVRAAAATRELVSVRDEPSRARLEAAGVDRQIDVVPDSAFLLPRVLPPEALARRRDQLRAAGQFPDDGPVVVVQGNSTMRGLVKVLANALGDLVPNARVTTVAVSPCHGDGRFADELSAALGARTWAVPDDAPLESVAAAIAGADCFLGVSLHGAITARAYGRPHVTLDPFGQAKLGGLADLLDSHGSRAVDPVAAIELVSHRLAAGAAGTPGTTAVEARIDAHFDRVAGIAARRAGRTDVDPVTWADTATPLHLALRCPPRRVDPPVGTVLPGLRRPDITPALDDLRSTVADALAVHRARRSEEADEHDELVRLRGEARDLRGALEHLEGSHRHQLELEATVARLRDELRRAERERSRLAAAVDSARASRVFRLTGRPSALRDANRQADADP